MRRLRETWYLSVPALFVLGLYALVYSEDRYVAPFLLLLWTCVFAAGAIEPQEHSLANKVAVAALVLFGVASLPSLTWAGRAPEPATSTGHLRVAAALTAAGARPGDHVATVGSGSDAYWAHVLETPVCAQIDTRTKLSPEEWDRALAALRTTDARFLVVGDVSLSPALEHAPRIAGTKSVIVPLR